MRMSVHKRKIVVKHGEESPSLNGNREKDKSTKSTQEIVLHRCPPPPALASHRFRWRVRRHCVRRVIEDHQKPTMANKAAAVRMTNPKMTYSHLAAAEPPHTFLHAFCAFTFFSVAVKRRWLFSVFDDNFALVHRHSPFSSIPRLFLQGLDVFSLFPRGLDF
jgi:hypothetical protein